MRLARLNPGFVTLAATQSLSKGVHDGKTLLLSVLSGHTITLPPATGAGTRIRILGHIAPSTNSNIIKVQNAIDVLVGTALITLAAGGAVSAFNTAATAGADTLTLNRTTTGGATSGEWMEFEDYAAGFWNVLAYLHGTTAPATPFSSAV
jgi:hypothetical protein